MAVSDNIREANESFRHNATVDDFVVCDQIRGRAEAYQARAREAVRNNTGYPPGAEIQGDYGSTRLDGERLDWEIEYDPDDNREDIAMPATRRTIRITLKL